MEQIGYVTQVTDGVAKIRVDRESACGGNCAGCHGCPQNAVIISLKDDKDNPFVVGEKVYLNMKNSHFFTGLFKSYGVLIVTMLIGAILGYCLSKTEGLSVLGGFIGLVIGGIIVRLVNNREQIPMSVRREKDNKGGQI